MRDSTNNPCRLNPDGHRGRYTLKDFYNYYFSQQPTRAYYENRIGSGGVIEHFYQGSSFQKGNNIGSFLRGSFRQAICIFSRGIKIVGKVSLRSGVRVLDDVAEENMNFKESLRTRLGKSGMNLNRKTRENIEHLIDRGGRIYCHSCCIKPRKKFLNTRQS